MHAYRLTYPWTVPRLMTMDNIENAAPPTESRTAPATAKRMRNRQEREADHLESVGWECFTPEGESWTLYKMRRAQESRQETAS